MEEHTVERDLLSVSIAGNVLDKLGVYRDIKEEHTVKRTLLNASSVANVLTSKAI